MLSIFTEVVAICSMHCTEVVAICSMHFTEVVAISSMHFHKDRHLLTCNSNDGDYSHKHTHYVVCNRANCHHLKYNYSYKDNEESGV